MPRAHVAAEVDPPRVGILARARRGFVRGDGRGIGWSEGDGYGTTGAHTLTATWNSNVLCIAGSDPPFRAFSNVGPTLINQSAGCQPYIVTDDGIITIMDRIGQTVTVPAKKVYIPDFIWYKLTEQAGTIMHDSGAFGYHGVFNGSYSLGDGLIVSGAGWGESPTLPADYRSGNVSITAWAKTVNRGDLIPGGFTPSSYPPSIVSNDVPGNGGMGIGAGIWNNGGEVREYVDGLAFTRTAVPAVSDGWEMISLVRDADNGLAKFYRNGVKIYEFAWPSVSSVANTIKVGMHNYDSISYPGDKRWYHGRIRDVRIFLRPLTDQEEAGIFAAGYWTDPPEEWPPGGVIPAGWVNGASATKGWMVLANGGSDGGPCLVNEDIGDGQTAAIQVTATTTGGNVSFTRKTSSESSYDKLLFYIDGVLQTSSWSGATPWGGASYPVAAGTHTYRWVYSKDGSVSTGADSAYIDDVRLPP